MNTAIQIFTSDIFDEIRTCQINNQIMFVGKDVATALGYAKSRNALAAHVDEEDKKDALIQGSLGGTQKTEVLPQIRMTGGYIPTHDADGHNATSIGICYIGGLNAETGEAENTMTAAQTNSLFALVEFLRACFPAAKVYGHRQFANRDCPCFDVKVVFPCEWCG